ncbi:hypothetical protein Nepgr_002520 [Nepenthes gracilis]|uniref:Uncharacterized protein n=1 Tax=Nepenthes gracilis TaxID=150966 RepID=A0AAD3RYB5_NEPGR|nr:hypothetical protein Nepgr_002520 [Nepenthes gracilis]
MAPQAKVLLRLELPTTAGSTGELPLDQPGSDVVERTLIEEGSVSLAHKESHTDPKALDVRSSELKNASLEISTSAAIISHCCQSLSAGVETRESTPSGRTISPHRSPLLPRPERPSTPAPSSRIPLRVAAQKARYIMIAVKLDPTFPVAFFDPRNLGARFRSDLKEFSEAELFNARPVHRWRPDYTTALASHQYANVYAKSRRRSITDDEIATKKRECYGDIERFKSSGLWGWDCKSSTIAKENCVLQCLSPRCYELVYGGDPLEEGEKDFIRSQEYKYCMIRLSMGESVDGIKGSFNH